MDIYVASTDLNRQRPVGLGIIKKLPLGLENESQLIAVKIEGLHVSNKNLSNAR